MEQIDIEYLHRKADLLWEMSEQEFKEWIVCDDCSGYDYTCLVEYLRDEEMYERIVLVEDYLDQL